MPTRENIDFGPFIVDKPRVQRILSAKNDRSLIPVTVQPTMTPRQLRDRMQAMGVRAEDNIGSCGIIAARDEE